MRLLFDKNEIDKRTQELANKLNREYINKDVVIIYIEKGGKPFFDKLYSKLDIDAKSDSIRVKSYTDTQSGELIWIKKPTVSLKNSVCLIVDDILDTGQTMKKVKEFMFSQGAKECKVCVAVNKHERRTEDIEPDYYLFDLDKGFIIGFGMDYNEDFRQLPEIYSMD